MEFEQVRLSLGHYDSRHNSWGATVFFATDKDNDIQGLSPGVLITQVSPYLQPINASTSSQRKNTIYYGTTDSYVHLRDDRDSGDYARPDNAFYSSPWLFTIKISSLPPCSMISYKVGLFPDPANGQQGDAYIRQQLFRFKTPPKLGDFCKGQHDSTDKPKMKIAVVGDLGMTEYSQSTRDMIMQSHLSQPFEASILVGDISYADGDQSRWDGFGRMFETMTAILPLMVLPGNHEIELEKNTQATFLSYRKRYFMPEVEGSVEKSKPALRFSPEDFKHYDFDITYDFGSSFYSLNIGKVHFVMLNTYDTYYYYEKHMENVQLKWFKKDLAKVDRSKTPFIVLSAHTPVQSTSKAHENETATELFMKWVDPLIIEYNIDLILAGHVHAYERLQNNTESGPVYITIGDGGNHERLYKEWKMPRAPWSKFRSGDYYGHGEILVYNDTHMRWIWKPNPSQITAKENLHLENKNLEYHNFFHDEKAHDETWIIRESIVPGNMLIADVENGFHFFYLHSVLFLLLLMLMFVGIRVNGVYRDYKLSLDNEHHKRAIREKFNFHKVSMDTAETDEVASANGILNASTRTGNSNKYRTLTTHIGDSLDSSRSKDNEDELLFGTFR